MAANTDRRDALRDAAIEVLAGEGSRGLTHRAVDAAAHVPSGTAKNYFPTRDALLAGVADRCLERYRELGSALPAPDGREGLVALLRSLLEDATGPGRTRLLAYLELHGEAARKPWLAETLGHIAATDVALFEGAQRAAGLPVTPQRARAVTMTMHAAVTDLLAHRPPTLAVFGLDDPGAFVRGLLDAVYGAGAE